MEWFGGKPSKQYNIYRDETNGEAYTIIPNFKRVSDLIYNEISDSTISFKCALNLARAVKSVEYSRLRYYSRGKVVQLETGFYGISDEIQIPNGVQLKGYGPTKSWIVDITTGGLSTMLKLRKDNEEAGDEKIYGNYIKLNDLGLRGAGANSTGASNWKTNHIISGFECIFSIEIDNCRIEKGKNLVKFENCFGDVQITNSNLSYASSSIISLIKCHGFKLDHCRVEVCKNFDPQFPDDQKKHDANPSAAIKISRGGQPILIQNTIIQFNAGYGIWARGVNLLNIFSCYFEDNFIFTNGNNTNTGCQVIIKDSVQANVVGNSFTQERPNMVDTVNPPDIFAIRLLNSRLFDFRGNRVTNNKITGGNMVGAYLIDGALNANVLSLGANGNIDNYISKSNFLDL